jgi:CAAX protease family protein
VLPEASESLHEALPAPRPSLSRGRLAAEVFLCSGFPTQLTIAAVLASIGIMPLIDGALSPTFVFTNLLIDSIVLLALLWFFLRQSGEDPRAVFFGSGPIEREIRIGMLSVPLVLTIVVAIQLVVSIVAPSLHNVPQSPFDAFLGSRWMLAGFIAVLVLAGGLREELQRAFLLHRFEQGLGGQVVGLLLTSIAFGLGHTMQGWDAAIATGTLGAFWGVLYAKRRSAAASIVSHAIFNVIQVVAGYAALTS